MHGLDRATGELDQCLLARVAGRHAKPVLDVGDDITKRERRQFTAHRHTLVDLPHLRQPQVVAQLRLTHEHHLQQLLALLELGEDTDLLHDAERQVLGFVDHQHREGLQRHQRVEELVERIAEVLPRGALQPSTVDVGHRRHAESDEQHLEQVFAGDEGVGHERAERLAIELRQDRAAQRGLAGADLTGEDDEPFAAADAGAERLEGGPVRGAVVEEGGIRRQAERLVLQAERTARTSERGPHSGLSVGADHSCTYAEQASTGNRGYLGNDGSTGRVRAAHENRSAIVGHPPGVGARGTQPLPGRRCADLHGLS
jgi:hypothetical protein